MLAQRRVAHRVAPVDQPLLQLSSRRLSRVGVSASSIVRSNGQGKRIGEPIVRDVGADAPIGALAVDRVGPSP